MKISHINKVGFHVVAWPFSCLSMTTGWQAPQNGDVRVNATFWTCLDIISLKDTVYWRTLHTVE